MTAASACAVTAFFYLWYGTPASDGRWLHWNHSVLPHWDAKVQAKFAHLEARELHPPEQIHAPFYPLRGPYSVRDGDTLRGQLAEAQQAGVDVLALSWWGQPDAHGTGDSQGVNTDAALEEVFRAADAVLAEGGPAARLAFHLEPYPGRDVESVRADVMHLHERFARRPAAAKDARGRLLFFVYDSYHIKDWARLLRADGDLYLGKDFPSEFVGLWLNADDGETLSRAGFDGAYTYFASTGFSFGSSPRNWPRMAAFLASRGMRFHPSVGPGYDDTGIRPWNHRNTRPRRGTAYYDEMWQAALDCGARAISITSFNEWGEGTQIEPARRADGTSFQDYGPGGPSLFLERTAHWKARCDAEAASKSSKEEL